MPGKLPENVFIERPQRQQLSCVPVSRRQHGKLEKRFFRRVIRQKSQPFPRLRNRLSQPVWLPSVPGDISWANNSPAA